MFHSTTNVAKWELLCLSLSVLTHIDGLVQDYCISSIWAREIWQLCIEDMKYIINQGSKIAAHE